MKPLVRALLGALALLCAASASATGIIPLSGGLQLDNATGLPLNGGQLYTYAPGTTTPVTAYSDFGLTTPLANPIVLNAAGRVPAIYMPDGSVRLRLLNAASVLQIDMDNVAVATAASGGGSLPIPDATQLWGTRDVKIRFDDQPLSGYVRLNGRTIGSAISGATERANADTQSLFTQLWGFANVSVSGGKGPSAAADWASNKALVLPDMAGRLLGARDDLGNGAAGRITSTTVTGPTVVGANGGQQVISLFQTNLPNVNFAITATAAAQAIADNKFTTQSVTHTTSDVNVLAGGSTTLGITAASSAVTGTAASGGSQTPVITMPPVMLFTVYIKL